MNKYLEREWDYLIILDAARYDSFETVVQQTGLEGALTLFDSEATTTAHWYRKHWAFQNEVNLITASVQPHKRTRDGIPLRNFFKTAVDAWFPIDRSGRVSPRITLHFVEQNRYPGERHLVHFIPPHLPFLGEKGKALSKIVITPDVVGRHAQYMAFSAYGRNGHWPEMREVYEENLLFGLRGIEEGFDRGLFPGKVVITADHGELLGETGRYWHVPARQATPEEKRILKRVPWFEVTGWRETRI